MLEQIQQVDQHATWSRPLRRTLTATLLAFAMYVLPIAGLCLLPAGAAQAADAYWVGIDLDPGAVGGCDFDLRGVEADATDIDLLLELSVDPDTSPMVTGSQLHTCNPGSNLFENPTPVGPAPWPIGVVVVPEPGAVGHIVEASVPESFLLDASQVRLVLLAETASGALDVLSTTDGTPTGGPILFSLAAAVPLLSPAGLAILLSLLLASGWLLSKRWGNRIGLILILGFIASVPVVAYALDITLDGLVGDWGATSPVASDSNNDSIPAGPEAEIVDLYATQGGGRLSLRVDALRSNGEEIMGTPLSMTFTPQLLVDQLLIEVADAWLSDPAISLDIEVTGINGGFEFHGDDIIDVVDTTVFTTDGSVAQTVVDWTQDTVTRNVNEVYTICVQALRNGTQLIGPVKCGAFGPF